MTAGMRNSRATIRQVASAAGVSTQTVSRVLNRRPDVSAETRSRVQQVIDDLGYQPSALARSLIRQRSYTLGVVTAGLRHIGPSRTLGGITAAAAEAGYSLLLEELPRYDTEEITPLLQSLRSQQVDGVIWAVPEVGDNRRWINRQQPEFDLPIVYLAMEPRPNVSMVSVNNYLGGRLVNLVIRSLILRSLQDTQCGFKCFRAPVAEDLFRRQTMDGWSFDIELLFVAYRRSYRVVEIPIDWYYRRESKVSALRDALRMTVDIFQIHANARRGVYDAH